MKLVAYRNNMDVCTAEQTREADRLPDARYALAITVEIGVLNGPAPY